MAHCCCGQQQKWCALVVVLDQEVSAPNIPADAAGGSAAVAAPEEGSALAKTGAPAASSSEVVAADAGSAVSFITTVEVRFDLNLSRLDPIRIEQGRTRKEEARYLLFLDRYVFVTGLELFHLRVALPSGRGGRGSALPDRPLLAQEPCHVLLHLLNLCVQPLQPLILLHGLALHAFCLIRALPGQMLGSR